MRLSDGAGKFPLATAGSRLVRLASERIKEHHSDRVNQQRVARVRFSKMEPDESAQTRQ